MKKEKDDYNEEYSDKEIHNDSSDINKKQPNDEMNNEQDDDKEINDSIVDDKEELCSDNEVNAEPFLYTMSLVSGKWKMHILFWLSKRDVFRYGELKKVLGKITHKMLSNQLKELENDELIIRTQYNEIPPKVEYSLSEKGKSLMPVLNAICRWGHDHIPEPKDEE